MEIECINDENLEDVSGGFIYDEMGPIILKVKCQICQHLLYCLIYI